MIQKEIFTSLKTTWAVWKLTQSTCKDITSKIDRKNIHTVVEFWPGRWNITQEILNKLWPNWKLICFEINETDFKPHLNQINDSRLSIHYTSCEALSDYITAQSVDLIISTIPLSLIDNESVHNIFSQSYTALRTGGICISGNYSTYGKKFMKPVFGNITSRRHIRNIPPVCILTSIKS